MPEIDDRWLNVLDNDQVSENENENESSTGYETKDKDPMDDQIDSTKESTTEVESGNYDENSDLIANFLKSKGIEDPTKLQYEDEENQGQTKDVDFNSLSKREQFEILNNISDGNLSEYEKGVVNYLRSNKTTLDQLIDNASNQKMNQYIQSHPSKEVEKSYTIDDYQDDELYLADLKTKFPDFTNDELLAKLNTAKEDEELFKKEIGSLRTYYKSQEDEQIKVEEAEQNQKYEDMRNNLIDSTNKLQEIPLDFNDPQSDSISLEDIDRQQIIDYLLNQDSDGKSQFVKDIEDPNSLVELALLRTQGHNLISGMTQYWKGLLKEDRKEIARLKKQLGNNDVDSKVTVMPRSQNNNIKNYNDLGNDLI